MRFGDFDVERDRDRDRDRDRRTYLFKPKTHLLVISCQRVNFVSIVDNIILFQEPLSLNNSTATLMWRAPLRKNFASVKTVSNLSNHISVSSLSACVSTPWKNRREFGSKTREFSGANLPRGADRKPLDLQPGQVEHGFKVLRTVPVPSYNLTMIEVYHTQTHIHTHRHTHGTYTFE